VVGFSLSRPSLLNTKKGIRFTPTPKSHNDFSKEEFPIVQVIIKLPESFNLGGNFLCKIVLIFG
jgi:hypothetical protein